MPPKSLTRGQRRAARSGVPAFDTMPIQKALPHVFGFKIDRHALRALLVKPCDCRRQINKIAKSKVTVLQNVFHAVNLRACPLLALPAMR